MINYREILQSILHSLFTNGDFGDELNYDNVDDFYAHLGYDLNLNQELIKLGIEGTSDLLDFLKEYEESN